ncbi:MauE/DoxX family redox-associated membrane protein [Allokutzneria multivorans]|uniref:MauE/DoxX family redox-associated membrane protein n=1 Tax=Allokutzneria multivorans TaxID=1142134 RepID=UPI0031E58900
MLPALTTAVAAAAAVLLLFAGAGHARDRLRLRGVLRVQALLPRRAWGPVSTALGPVEIVVGLAALVGYAQAQAALYAVFAVYLTILRSRRSSAPCGCLGADEPATWVSVLRAVVAAAASAFAPVEMELTVRALCVAGGFVLAMIVILASLSPRDESRPGAR